MFIVWSSTWFMVVISGDGVAGIVAVAVVVAAVVL